ncbi:hypothetical protein EcE24377A_4291 [Escherichia coli O139:H28 str. E24377A]|uniref:Uncharacterized protein n=1 Tax=Escherichia coli O139:H28 (strain E24377A / ETEC) TaxID=331111 RepID=A7ZTY1_ECO24|nr:hypothetical protein EcE24377A_4291 [Escherichia coli O139:H28 str. E24377A]
MNDFEYDILFNLNDDDYAERQYDADHCLYVGA